MKKQLGQFFTKNSDHILWGFEEFIKNKEVVDPFAGRGDLIEWSIKNKCKKAIGFDYDKNYVNGKNVFYNDSINFPKKYNFICTNPPYLHKNKADFKTKEKFFSGINSQFEDLYQISISSLLGCKEGILILPLNFLCAENAAKIRKLFFSKFEIFRMNVFLEQVFEDTTYNVISFCFKEKDNNSVKNEFSATIFPQKEKISLILEKKYNWQCGGEFINAIKNTKNDLGIFRLTKDYLKSGRHEVKMAFQNINDRQSISLDEESKGLTAKNIIFLRAIDSKNGKKIQLEDIRDYGVSGLIGKESSRNMAHLIFRKDVSIKEQIELMDRFNKELNSRRNQYFSFFLTNFRDNNRKRISFEMAYRFLNYIYNEKNSRQPVLF
jgi:hypothetical protein